MSEAIELRRTLGLGMLVLYGLGVTVGAGIYALVGTAATRAGIHAPVAFMIAAAVMALSAASFAELSARFPVAAGEAAYVEAGLASRRLSLLVGLLVVAAGLWREPSMLADLPLSVEGLGSAAPWKGVLGASLIAVFAFIGFESMVNVAEEVKRPERLLPMAIAITITISTVLYILVVWVVINSVPAADIAASQAPVSLAYERLTGASPVVISLIAIVATINGVIVQMVMSSRVLYGLARRGALPAILGRIDRRTQTPLIATVFVIAVTLALAVAFPIDRLADATTRMMLVVFSLVNLALVVLKRREGNDGAALAVPLAVPVLGVVSCLGLLIADLIW